MKQKARQVPLGGEQPKFRGTSVTLGKKQQKHKQVLVSNRLLSCPSFRLSVSQFHFPVWGKKVMYYQRLCQGSRLKIPLSTCSFLNSMRLNSRALFLWDVSQNSQEQVVLVSWKAEGSQNRNSEVHKNAQRWQRLYSSQNKFLMSSYKYYVFV